MSPQQIGEIIEASTTHFTAQTFEKQTEALTIPIPPSFGSFVRSHSEEMGIDILGVVYNVTTGSIDGTHHPTALNLSRQQLREQQPQIFDLLKTNFSAVIIAYVEKRTYFQFLPPYPPQIHDFVYTCSETEVSRVTDRLFFLRTLLNTPGIHDELIAATLRLSYRARGNDRLFVVEAGRELANLLKDNYDRLTAILQRVEPIIVT